MNREVAGAIWEWAASLVIGLMPLFMHGVLHLLAKPATGWEDSWAGDIYFVAISNSGLSVVTVYIRVVKKSMRLGQAVGSSYLNMAVSLAFFVFAAVGYGLVASGHSTDSSIWAAVFFLVGSLVSSLIFEIILAANTPPA